MNGMTDPSDDEIYYPKHFDVRIGEGTELAATIHFDFDGDICGEGYCGYDYTITFDLKKFNLQDSWFVEGYTGDGESAKEAADSYYKVIVAFIERLMK